MNPKMYSYWLIDSMLLKLAVRACACVYKLKLNFCCFLISQFALWT